MNRRALSKARSISRLIRFTQVCLRFCRSCPSALNLSDVRSVPGQLPTLGSLYASTLQVPLCRVPLPVVVRTRTALRRMVPRCARPASGGRWGDFSFKSEQGSGPHGRDQGMDQAVRRQRGGDCQVVKHTRKSASSVPMLSSPIISAGSTGSSARKLSEHSITSRLLSLFLKSAVCMFTRKLHRSSRKFTPSLSAHPRYRELAEIKMRIRRAATLSLASAGLVVHAYTSPPVVTSIEASWPAPDLVTQYL